MFITLFIVSAIGGVGGAGLVSKLRKRSDRLAAEKAVRDAEAAAGREAHPTVEELLRRCGFEILEGRPRPVPEMHGKLSLDWMRNAKGDYRHCEYTHEAINRARQEHATSDYLRVIEQVVADGTRASYRKIACVCQLCLHLYPIQDADPTGTAFEGHLKDHQSLRDVAEGIDAVALLEERRAWLQAELRETEADLLNAAHANPARLADHPHRGHPLLDTGDRTGG